MTTHKIIAMMALGVSALVAHAASKPNLLSIKESITDDKIEYPYSFQTDTHAMLKNWYLENYAALDADVENKSYGDVSEETYINRLAAMPVEIEMPYNAVVRSYIDRYVQRSRTLVEAMLGMSLYYMPIFEAALDKEGLPLELKYLPIIESALNPDAVSPAGAVGLWQFMVGTGKDLGLEINSLVDERRDPYRSSEAAAKYLKQLYKIYGDWSLVIASYNCGPGNVNKALQRAAIEDGKGQEFWAIYNYLPRETRGYVPAFIAANYVMTYYREHNISPSLAKKPLLIDTVAVKERVDFNQIEAVLGVPMEALKVLNPQYRKEVVPGNNHPYMLALPAQQVYSYMMSRDSIVNYRKDLYGQRKVAEPASLSGDDDYSQEYTYETRTETVYHKVGRRETLSSIAKKYGVSTSSIRQSNGLGRKAGVSRGQKLKIVTTKRVKVAKKAEAEEPIEGAEQNEMIMIDDIGQDTTGDSAAASAPATSGKGKVTKLNIDSKGNITEVVEKPLARKKELAAKKEAAAKETSAKKEPAAKEPATTSYTVKAGDTLGKIATRYGVTVDELEAANNLKNSTIKLGDNLVIPAKGSAKAAAAAAKEPAAPRSFTYIVRTGDSLAKIASRNGTTIDAIKKANGLKDDDITIGQKLSIPGKESTAKKKPRRKKK